MSAKKRRAYRKLAETQGGRCTYCGIPLTEPGPEGRTGPTTRTLDHVVPRCRGGTNGMHNLVLACLPCNQAKGDMLPLEFININKEVLCSSRSG